MKKILLQFTLILFTIGVNAQQVLVNQMWVTSSGEPDQLSFPFSEWDNIDWSSTHTFPNGYYVTVGNTLVAAGDTDILVSVYNSNGQIAWEQTFGSPSNSHDYGLTVTADSQNNIIVGGTVTTSNETTDIIVLKYSPLGALISSNTIDGGNNLHDVPTAIITDQSDNIYVCGGTLSANLETDWLISKISATASLGWTTTYDYANLHDLPLSMSIGFDYLSVSGFSTSSSTEIDFADIRYSQQNGSLLNQNRELIPDLSFTKSISIQHDDNGNIYIAGTSIGSTPENPDATEDIQLIKINSDFDIDWTRRVDAKGLKDNGRSLDIGSDGKIVIVGNSEKANNKKQITITRYSPEGQEEKRVRYQTATASNLVDVTKVKVSDEGDMFVIGATDNDGNRDFMLLMYDAEGILRFEKIFSGEGNSDDVLTDIDISNEGEVIVTGKSVGNEVTYVTAKFEYFKKINEVVNINDRPHHLAKELIVKFRPELINTAFVDDTGKRYGTLSDILSQETLDKLNERLRTPFERDVKVIKVFPRLTTNHKKSITRLGREIDVPKFWSAFVLSFTSEVNLDDLLDELNSLFEFIEYAELNYLYEPMSVPNDEFYTGNEQKGLQSEEFPEANINIEPAWDLETGQDYVKIGIFDQPVAWDNEDFHLGEGQASFISETQISGGWNYVDHVYIANMENFPYDHGVAVAGIIGAIRNNDKGIAGIAGGGPTSVEGSNNPGVRLFSMGIVTDENASLSVQANAIVEGALKEPNEQFGGYGLHVQNWSYGGANRFSLLTKASVKFCFRNECSFVAARGNARDGIDALVYPACYQDEMVINVGGVGTDGQRYSGGNGNAPTFLNFSRGGEMDISAPGVTELVTTTNSNNPVTIERAEALGTATGIDSYHRFFGTSAAAPHVSGLAGLMYSLHNINQNGGRQQFNNLAPDDIENLIEKNTNGFPIYTEDEGFGVINAYETLRKVKGPQYRVIHNGDASSTEIESFDIELINLDDGIDIDLPGGYYLAERRLVGKLYDVIIPDGYTLIDYWPRLSSTLGVSGSNQVTGEIWANMFPASTDGNNITSFVVYTNTWHITSSQLGQEYDIWYPAAPEDIEVAFSMHIHNPSTTNVSELNDDKYIEIFPSPTEGQLTISFENGIKSIQIFSAEGRLIKSYEKGLTNSPLNINIESLSSGIYYLHFVGDNGAVTKEVMKL